MISLLAKVQRKMTITAHRRVRHALEGQYSSIFKGRGLDFDDLRVYVQGDDIKDIDWHATARTGQVLIRRYIAIRKYNILLVVDTGRSMAATAPSGENKRDLAIMTAGAIATVAQKHEDLVGLIAGNSVRINRLPMHGSPAHIERILQCINNEITLDGPTSDLDKLLDYVKRTIRRRMLLVIISDRLRFADADEQLLRRLRAQHEILFMAMEDLDPSNHAWQLRKLRDVNQSAVRLPTYVRSQPAVGAAYQAHIVELTKQSEQLLKHLGISSVRVASEDEVITKIATLLEKQKHGHR